MQLIQRSLAESQHHYQTQRIPTEQPQPNQRPPLAADPNGSDNHLEWHSISRMPHRLEPDIGRRYRRVGAVVPDCHPTRLLLRRRLGSAQSHHPPPVHSDRSAMLSGWMSPRPNGWHRAPALRTGRLSRTDRRRRMRVDCCRRRLPKHVLCREMPHSLAGTLHQQSLPTS